MTFRPLMEPGAIVFYGLVLLALILVGCFRAKSAVDSHPGAARPWLVWLRRALIAALVVFSLAGPAVREAGEETTSNVEIVFAVDRTGSMAAEDGPGGAPRFDGVRADIAAIVEGSPGARYAVLTWDSSARVELPFTTDASAVLSFAEVLHQEITVYSKGSSLDRPVAELKDLLESAAEQRPENVRYLILFSDGEASGGSATQEPATAFESLRTLIDGGGVIGYGTSEGGVMRLYQPGQGWDDSVPDGQYIVDPDAGPGGPRNEQGEPLAVSVIDTASLTSVSESLGVPLLINPSEAEVRSFSEALMEKAEQLPTRTGKRYTYSYVLWAPALAILALLAWEIPSDARKLGQLRRTRAI